MREIEYPFKEDVVRALRVGELVRLAGRVFTARDRLHCYLFEGGKCPVDLTDGAIYHCGPIVTQNEGRWSVRSAGPTTSMRQEPYMAKVIRDHHVRVIVGKGGMGEGTRRACKAAGCVYVQTVGGAGALEAGRIESVESVHFLKEFGTTEALWTFIVRGLEGVVTMDAMGRSLHKRVAAASRRALAEVLE